MANKLKSLDQVLKVLQKKVDDALNNEVFQVVKETEKEVIKDIVYDSYTPTMYDRRKDGGLSDDKNIVKENEAVNGYLSVINITEPNPVLNNDMSLSDNERMATVDKNLPELIEYGNGYKGYQYDKVFSDTEKYSYLQPRPFTHITKLMLDANKKHVKALKIGLIRQGLDVN